MLCAPVFTFLPWAGTAPDISTAARNASGLCQRASLRGMVSSSQPFCGVCEAQQVLTIRRRGEAATCWGRDARGRLGGCGAQQEVCAAGGEWQSQRCPLHVDRCACIAASSAGQEPHSAAAGRRLCDRMPGSDTGRHSRSCASCPPALISDQRTGLHTADHSPLSSHATRFVPSYLRSPMWRMRMLCDRQDDDLVDVLVLRSAVPPPLGNQCSLQTRCESSGKSCCSGRAETDQCRPCCPCTRPESAVACCDGVPVTHGVVVKPKLWSCAAPSHQTCNATAPSEQIAPGNTGRRT